MAAAPGEFRYRGSHRRLGFRDALSSRRYRDRCLSGSGVHGSSKRKPEIDIAAARSVSDDVRRALLDDARAFLEASSGIVCARRSNGRVSRDDVLSTCGTRGRFFGTDRCTPWVNEAPSRAEPGSRARYPPSLAEAPHIKCQIGQVCRLELRLHVRDLILSPCTARSHARRALSSRNARSGIANGEGRSPTMRNVYKCSLAESEVPRIPTISYLSIAPPF